MHLDVSDTLSLLALQLSHLWLVGTFSIWLFSLPDMLLRVFDSFLASWYDNMIQALINVLLQIRTQLLPKYCGFVYWCTVFRNHPLCVKRRSLPIVTQLLYLPPEGTRGAWKGFYLGARRGDQPSQHFDSGLLTPELSDNKFVMVSCNVVLLWYSSSSELTKAVSNLAPGPPSGPRSYPSCSPFPSVSCSPFPYVYSTRVPHIHVVFETLCLHLPWPLPGKLSHLFLPGLIPIHHSRLLSEGRLLGEPHLLISQTEQIAAP